MLADKDLPEFNVTIMELVPDVPADDVTPVTNIETPQVLSIEERVEQQRRLARNLAGLADRWVKVKGDAGA